LPCPDRLKIPVRYLTLESLPILPDLGFSLRISPGIEDGKYIDFILLNPKNDHIGKLFNHGLSEKVVLFRKMFW